MSTGDQKSFIYNNQWAMVTTHGTILPSECSKRQEYEETLSTTHLPDMVFDKTTLTVTYLKSNLKLSFNVYDALKSIDMHTSDENIPKVSMSQTWIDARREQKQDLDYVKPYDWTYTTKYRGTLINNDQQQQQWHLESTEQPLNLEKLKEQEKILFYDELTLYEDELADNGISNLSCKIRCMPSGYFILLRFYMRVDGVMIRCNDTRYHYEMENDYILREYIERESEIKNLDSQVQYTTDVNQIIPYLSVKQHQLERLYFRNK